MEPISIPHDPQALRAAIAEHATDRDVYLRGVVLQGAEALAAEITQGKSEHLLAYLDFSARFCRYSAHNQALIYAQCPGASFVAAYKRWQDMGYQVRKGERGIRIFAPRPYKQVNQESGDVEREGLYFVVVPVFDASQVEPISDAEQTPIPTFFRSLGDEAAALDERLVQVIEADGITVIEQEGLGETQGYSSGGRIATKMGLDPTNRFLTRIHEYAHELLHQNAARQTQPRQVKECEAEAVSYIVARHFGIHNPFSADYLQSWGNTGAELMAQLDAIQHAAAHIVDRLEPGEAERRASHQRRTTSDLPS